MKSRVFLAASVFVAVACLCVAGAAQSGQQIPFKGAIQGQETDTITDGQAVANGVTTGIATLLGQLSFNYVLTINLSTGTAAGTGHFIAANGDQVFTDINGSATFPTPGFARITEIDTITGGTGRFAGAQGSFVVERLVNQATGFTSGSFNGTITSPGAAH